MAPQTLAQQRARHAWDEVQEGKKRLATECREELARKGKRLSPADLEKAELKKFDDKFAGPAKKMPIRIRASGLGQTVAFMCAKEGGEVVAALTAWCRQRELINQASDDALMIQFKDGTAADLRQLTAEALAYLEWLVRFADAAKGGKS